MVIIDLIKNLFKKNCNEELKFYVNSTVSSVNLHNNNIVYPKDKDAEINKLYEEIRNYNKDDNKHSHIPLKENKIIQRKLSSYVSPKQKYKELEEKANLLDQKGDNIIIKD